MSYFNYCGLLIDIKFSFFLDEPFYILCIGCVGKVGVLEIWFAMSFIIRSRAVIEEFYLHGDWFNQNILDSGWESGTIPDDMRFF